MLHRNAERPTLMLYTQNKLAISYDVKRNEREIKIYCKLIELQIKLKLIYRFGRRENATHEPPLDCGNHVCPVERQRRRPRYCFDRTEHRSMSRRTFARKLPNPSPDL